MKHTVTVATSFAVGACSCSEAQAIARQPLCADNRAVSVAGHQKTPRRVPVSVTAFGYEPGIVEARAGEATALVLQRVAKQGCDHQIVFPSGDLRRGRTQEVGSQLIALQGETASLRGAMGRYRGGVVVSPGRRVWD